MCAPSPPPAKITRERRARSECEEICSRASAHNAVPAPRHRLPPRPPLVLPCVSKIERSSDLSATSHSAGQPVGKSNQRAFPGTSSPNLAWMPSADAKKRHANPERRHRRRSLSNTVTTRPPLRSASMLRSEGCRLQRRTSDQLARDKIPPAKELLDVRTLACAKKWQ